MQDLNQSWVTQSHVLRRALKRSLFLDGVIGAFGPVAVTGAREIDTLERTSNVFVHGDAARGDWKIRACASVRCAGKRQDQRVLSTARASSSLLIECGPLCFQSRMAISFGHGFG